MSLSRGRRFVLLAGVVVLGALCVAGLAHSLMAQRRLPGIWESYSDAINRQLQRGDGEGALRQMRLVVDLSVDDPAKVERVLEPMASLARELGRRDDELCALRQMVLRRPKEVGLRERLAEVLLDQQSPPRSDLREAATHAEMAVMLDPRSVRGWSSLSRVAGAMGQQAESREFSERAQRIAQSAAPSAPVAP